MTASQVTVIVVTYNSADVIPGFIEGLRRSTADLDWRLVVVDNASGDGSAEIAQRLAPEAVVLRQPDNSGYAAGINAGLRESSPGPVLLLNPDITLQAEALNSLLEALKHSGAGIVVPQLRDSSGRLLYSLRREPSIRRVLGEAILGGDRAGRYDAWGEVVTVPERYASVGTADWATGACMLVSPECVHAVGSWDERYFLYSEETDFVLRARDAGFVLRYEPAAIAEHVGGEAHTSPRLFALLTVNRWRLYRERHSAIAASAFWAALVLDALPRALLGRRTSRASLAALLLRRRTFRLAPV